MLMNTSALDNIQFDVDEHGYTVVVKQHKKLGIFKLIENNCITIKKHGEGKSFKSFCCETEATRWVLS